MLLEPACLKFLIFLRLPANFAQNRTQDLAIGITQGVICFRDIDFGVKGQGQKVCFFRRRVSDCFFIYGPVWRKIAHKILSVFVTLTSGSKVKVNV